MHNHKRGAATRLPATLKGPPDLHLPSVSSNPVVPTCPFYNSSFFSTPIQSLTVLTYILILLFIILSSLFFVTFSLCPTCSTHLLFPQCSRSCHLYLQQLYFLTAEHLKVEENTKMLAKNQRDCFFMTAGTSVSFSFMNCFPGIDLVFQNTTDL